MRKPLASLILAASTLGLGACAYPGLGIGVGYGSGYGDPYYGAGYGYGSPYGYGGYGSPYGYGGYGSPYGYGGYGAPYYGWYNGYYYPGSGYYVYDRYRRQRLWTDAERRYWLSRLQSTPAGTTTTRTTSPDWSAFKQRAATIRAERGPNAVRDAERRRDERVERIRAEREGQRRQPR